MYLHAGSVSHSQSRRKTGLSKIAPRKVGNAHPIARYSRLRPYIGRDQIGASGHGQMQIGAIGTARAIIPAGIDSKAQGEASAIRFGRQRIFRHHLRRISQRRPLRYGIRRNQRP